MKRSKSHVPFSMSREELLALEAYSSSNFFKVNKKLFKAFGTLDAILITELMDKYLYWKEKGELTSDGFFFTTHEMIEEHVGLTFHQTRERKKFLREIGILETARRGIPSKEFYKINIENLLNYIDERIEEKQSKASLTEIERLEFQKEEGYTSKNRKAIKENKYKENKYKEKEDIVDSDESTSASISKESSPVKVKEKKPTPEQIIASWNKHTNKTELPSARLTPGRKQKIYTRIKSCTDLRTINEWSRLFRKAAASDFLCGDNDRNWQANFDWIVNNNSNYVKILEGNYDNKAKKKKPKTRLGGAEVIPGKYDDYDYQEYNPDTGELIFHKGGGK